ncbi:MAG: SDR family oxidoreductase [Rhodospirillales bacterium]|nr:SDR family oxidoreductase [Rhodospirillales bacterium]
MPTCFVTGAARGLGLEFARQYAAAGWRVVATYRRPNAVKTLSALSGDVRPYLLDVSDFAAIDRLARRLSNEAIDLLINNAGVYGPRVVPYDFVDYDLWEQVLRVNTMAPLKIAAAFSKNVAHSQRRLIVSLTSSMGSIGGNTSGGAYIYRSSKAALNAVTRSLALDLRGKEITVVVVNPGWVRTDMGGRHGVLDADASVEAMRQLFERLGIEDTGLCFDVDGRQLPW